MRFISVRELGARWAQVWRQLAKEGEIIITSNGKPKAILSAISPEGLEDALSALRRARAVGAVQAMQSKSVASGRHRLGRSDIEAEVAAVRKSRRGRRESL
jgi:antitoxin (DNA-binding transcriptional repressor) of toxin-antitoxin stability system